MARPAKCGLTAEAVPEDVTRDAMRPVCCPDSGSAPGFGYDGGGFGPYRICGGCGAVFGKVAARDGNQSQLA